MFLNTMCQPSHAYHKNKQKKIEYEMEKSGNDLFICFDRILATGRNVVQCLRYMRRVGLFGIHSAYVLHQSRSIPGHSKPN